MLPPPDPGEPTRVAAMFAGEPSVVQKIVGGLDQVPVAVTVTLSPGSSAPAAGLKKIPGAELSCAVPHRGTARKNRENSLSLVNLVSS
jgi:hypothetical protein